MKPKAKAKPAQEIPSNEQTVETSSQGNVLYQIITWIFNICCCWSEWNFTTLYFVELRDIGEDCSPAGGICGQHYGKCKEGLICHANHLACVPGECHKGDKDYCNL